jgi:hypothetical protein
VRAEIATLSQIEGPGPAWLRLRLDVLRQRLERLRMITVGRCMTQEWGAFARPLASEPPPAAQVQPESTG